MNNLTFAKVEGEEEIELLRGKKSTFNDLVIQYDEETITLLKENFKRKDSLYLIVRDQNDFVAFCSIDSDWWEDECFFIREIFIEPHFQKHGIGEKLMKTCIDHAKTHHAKGVITETDYKNVPMQKLCTKLGFKEWDNPQWKEGITYKLELL